MSVINKMLRDLDSRQTAAVSTAQAPESRPDVAGGTRVVHDAGHGRRWLGWPRAGVLMATTLIVCAGALAGWWYLKQGVAAPRPLEPASLAPAIAAQPVAAVATPAATETAVATASVMPLSAAAAPLLPELLATASAAKPAPVAADPSPKPAPLKAPLAVPAAAAVPAALAQQAAAPVNLSTSGPGGTPALPPGPARQPPALEALAQAQRLWSAGSHQAAMDLLRQALASAERSDLAGTAAANQAALVLLARELARMELAEGRVSQALETLTRLEPALSGSADVWALRGNAAQRLGRHAESVAAYLTALKLRPDEPRWMLGAAVSLAVQGQTASAAEWAEQARVGGALSPEVASYLRQLGVPLRAL